MRETTHQKSQEYAKSNQKKPFRHLLYPRTKGLISTVKCKFIVLCPELMIALKDSHIQYLYDLTFLYSSPGSKTFTAPSLDEQLSCPDLARAGYKFRIHARRFALADLPNDDEGLKSWCEQVWSEKDDWLDTEMKVDEKGDL